jgi:hypothetical protein
MKVWIDKQGGTHYHKEDCKMIGAPYHYEPIERRLRGNSLMGYRDIIVDGKRYSHCPMCFGDKRK